MKFRAARVMVVFLSLALSLTPLTLAQTSTETASALPRLVRFGGTVKDLNSNALTGVVGITFALYSEQTGGSPLWLETQNVTADNNGHYAVLLGSTKPEGLPAELFTSEQARWVGVQVSGQAEQPRVLLVSAPYALKAGDAETIGGLPPSAFVLAVPAIIGSAGAGSPAASTAESVSPATTSDVTTTGGTVNTIPLFSTATNIQNSILTQTAATAVNVSGKLNLPATAAATKTTGADSRPLDFVASSFSSTSSTALNQTFQWQAEPAANDTTAPSGTLNLLYGLGATTPSETGLKLSSKGLFTFATGQTFPGTGDGSVTSVATGLGLKGGPITKTGTLTIDTTVVPQLAVANTFKASQTIDGSLGINTAAPSQSLEVNSGNALVKGPENFKTTGNTASLYVGDTNHPIEAIWNTGLAIGTYEVPQALFIADYTGNVSISTGVVGIGTQTPGARLEVDAFQPNGLGNGLGIVANGSCPGGCSEFGGGGDGVQGNGGSGNGGGNGVGLSGLGGTSDVDNGAPGVEGFGGAAGTGAGPDGYTDGPGGAFQGATTSGQAGAGDGVDGIAGSGYAGNFTGDLNVSGAITAGTKDFKIDHPLDPANKYLVHASVESSEMKNIYDGVVTTDAQGKATVRLPEWFEALNTNFRYQLTVIGEFAQAIIGRKIENSRFEIRTSAPNVEVSWQVTGVRQDAYAKAHPLVVEQEKEARLRGFYIHPELYGAPPEKQIEWARHPQFMKKIQETRARQLARIRAAVQPATAQSK